MSDEEKLSQEQIKAMKEKENAELLVNCRKPEGELGEQMIERMNRSHESLAQWGVGHLNVCPDDVVLDIGCGGGVNVKRFSNMTKNKVYGIDYSATSVEKSKEYNREGIERGQVEILEASVSDLPFDDESIDIVTGFETVYFWPDLESDFREIYRVLKSDGAIFICNEEYDDGNLEERMAERIRIIDMHVPSEDELDELLRAAGFRDVAMFTVPSKHWLCCLARKE